MRKAIDRKTLTFPARDKLLASMTSDVGQLVLRDNYLQTQALTLAQALAADHLPIHVRCMQVMEKAGLLNRAVEYLPDDVDIAERQRLGKGLTRPELAVLMAYTKIWLYQKILDSELPDDPALRQDVDAYFPKALRTAYAKDIAAHQLRREIAATVLTNDLVNRTSVRIVLTMTERGDPESVARAYLLARDAFALPALWADVEALDNKIPAAIQTRIQATTRSALMRAIELLLADKQSLAHLAPSIAAHGSVLAQLGKWLGQHADTLDPAIHRVEMDWRAEGVPADVARRAAHVPVLVDALGLVGLAAQTKMPVGDLAAIFFGLEKRLDIRWLARLTVQATDKSPWQREAVAVALEELATNHRRLTALLAVKKVKGRNMDIAQWVAQNAFKLERYDAMLTEWRAAGVVDLAMLLLANEWLGELSA